MPSLNSPRAVGISLNALAWVLIINGLCALARSHP